METASQLSELISQPIAAGALFVIALELRALRSKAPGWIDRIETATERVVLALTPSVKRPERDPIP